MPGGTFSYTQPCLSSLSPISLPSFPIHPSELLHSFIFTPYYVAVDAKTGKANPLPIPTLRLSRAFYLTTRHKEGSIKNIKMIKNSIISGHWKEWETQGGMCRKRTTGAGREWLERTGNAGSREYLISQHTARLVQQLRENCGRS